MLEELKISKKVVGLKQTFKAVKENKAKKVFVALDADQQLTKQIIESCEKNGIAVLFADNMKNLGLACHIEVGCAICAIIE
jgi:large subunit ribosomal protein L7A